MATFSKRGDKWRAQVRRLGITSLSKAFPSKAAAQAWAREVEHQLDRGQQVDVGRRITLGDLMKVYRDEVGARKGMSRSKDHALLHIEAILGKRRLVELKTTAFVDFAKTREQEGAGPATILQDLSYLGTVIRHGGALANADAAVAVALSSLASARITLRHGGRVARPNERNRRPTDVEIAKLIEHWSGRTMAIPMIDLTLFATATAMRLGEILGLVWEDVDETTRTVVIRARKHPTKKAENDQRVPLLCGPFTFAGKVVDPLEIMLRQPSQWNRTGRVFPHAAQSASKAFQRATAAVEIDDLHFHDLRHDGASRLFEAGYSIEQVALVTGHRDWNMLRRYTQLRPEGLHRTLPSGAA